MSDQPADPAKRRFLTNLTTGVGAVGTAFAMTPFVLSMTPSARAKAAGAPVEIDIGAMQPGDIKVEEWRGKPVWIVRRTPEMLKKLDEIKGELADPDSERLQQPEYAKNATRAIKPEFLVVVGICTHLGCSPDKKIAAGGGTGMGQDWAGGFFCPCHGSKFDLAGRVYKNVPAPTNLEVPPHAYLSDSRILIGEDTKKGDA